MAFVLTMILWMITIGFYKYIGVDIWNAYSGELNFLAGVFCEILVYKILGGNKRDK